MYYRTNKVNVCILFLKTIMAYLTFFWWDYLILFLIIGFSISIGVYYGFYKKTNATSTEDVYLAKEIKTLPIAMSMVASTISVPDLLAAPAEIYMHGTQFWMEIFCLPIAGLIVALIYLPVLYNLKLSNSYQYLEKRFNTIISKLCLAAFLLPCIILIPLFMYASSLVFNQVSGYDVHVIAVGISSICIFYTAFGGLKAVIWADTLQLFVTLLSLSIALIMGIVFAGGFGNIWEKAGTGGRLQFFKLDPDPTIRTTLWNVLIGHIFRWIVFIILNPAATQRFLSASSIKDSKRVLLLFVFGMMIMKSILCFSGLIIYFKYFDCDPLSVGDIKTVDQIVPYYVLDVAQAIPGLGTLFTAGLIAVALSVLSTMLNVCTCSLYGDVISPFLSVSTKKKWGTSVTRMMTIFIGILGIGLVFVAEKFGSLFEMTYVAIGCFSGAILGITTMGAIFPFANVKGALSGGLVSMTFMLFLVVKAQIYIWNGTIQFETLPLSVDGCNETDVNHLNVTTEISQILDLPEKPFWLFRISFHYYVCIGCIICVIIGLTVSWFTRKDENVKPDLLSPVITKFVYKTTPTKKYEWLAVRDDSTVL